jgi:subtilisin-like proprotein convertase family protein
MRRVDAEGDSRGVREQQKASSRSRWKLRRAAIEWLERRELLSTSTSNLPSPTVISSPLLTANGTNQAVSVDAGNPLVNSSTEIASANSPSVSVDPLNPLKMVATWVDHDTPGFQPGGLTAPITNYIQGAFSLDGGQTWTALPGNSIVNVDFQRDFSVTPPTGSETVFTQTTDASIAFDRNQNFYLLSSTHNDANTAGILDLQRFSFTGNTPTSLGTTPVYSWDMADSAAKSGTADEAVTPTLAVDTNVASFTDPTTGVTQTDPFSGNIYAVWAEVDSNVYDGPGTFNPNTIRMAASADQGQHFTAPAYVDDSSNANIGESHQSSARYAAPQVTISQGNGTVPGGQVTIVYDDYGTQAPLDRILTQSDALGGVSEQFSPPAADLGQGTFMTASVNGTTVVVAQNTNTQIPINVNIPATTNNNVPFTLSSLDVSTTIQFDTLADLAVELTPPTAVNNFLAARFGAAYPGFILLYNATLTGANLGATSGSGFGTGSGTVFDAGAVRSIQNGNTGAHGTGLFRAVNEDFITALNGLTPATLNGTWNFAALLSSAYTATTLRFVNTATLNFSSGNNPGVSSTGAVSGEVTVADKFSTFVSLIPNINPTTGEASYGEVENSLGTNNVTGTNVSGRGSTTATTQGAIPILPAPVIAADDTLGSFSAHEGRIYVSFVGMLSDAQAGNTDIFMAFSDDGGKSWSIPTQVNDDNAATDGYSGSTPGSGLGRTQYQPQIEVDQSTGDVVLSFLDARNDPSDARVATYIAASDDGGASFAADVYANPSSFALDAVTGTEVNLGPIPDNQSTTGGLEDTKGYGTHQALIVVNGRIISFWASNENSALPLPGQAVARKLTIVDSILSLAAGPRIISSTQGPVGLAGDLQNTSRSADGTTLANTIDVTFDEPIDPTTFTIGDVSVFYEAPTGGAKISLPIVSVLPVASTALGSYQFAITFNPAGLSSFVGTYSYVIRPTGIMDRIRQVSASGSTITGNVMDQNANGVPGQPHDDDYTAGEPTTLPVTYASTATPAAIPAGGTLTTPINITDDYLIQGDNGVLPGVTVTLNATYPKDSDLTAFLEAPDPASPTGFLQIPLFARVGGSGANFTNTVLTDLATTPIASGSAPFTGSFQPATSFNTLNAAELSSIGTWELVIRNGGSSTGTLTSWSITLQPPQAPYSAGTLPLIVPGPHVSSTVAVNSSGTVISSGTNNLVLNNTVSAVDVTWDRNIQVSSFTPAQILSIFGPAGSVSLAGLTITPLFVFTPSGQMAYAGGGTADIFRVSFATQQVSGTYTTTIGTGIVAADGSGVDANLNAGLDVLKGTATGGITTPVSYTSGAINSAIAPATVNGNGTTSPSMLMSPIVIPDNFPIQGDSGTVSGITLNLTISYPNDPDLVAYLLSPTGTKVNLFSNVGAGTRTANFTNTTFSDTATTSIDKAAPPFFGTFTPEAPFANLATAGESSMGTWELVIENVGNSSGTLANWSLTFQKPVSSTGLAEFPDDQTQSSFQIFNLAANNALANSTWTAVGPAGITTVGTTEPVSYAATLAPIPATVAAATNGTSSILTSPIIVPDNFPLVADNGTVSGITVSLDISYPKDSDLSAFLLAPDGVTKINLFTNIGGTGAGFLGTTFSDTGGSSIDAGTAPFSGTFKPETSFSTLSDIPDLSSLGTWTLVVVNKGTSVGTLDDWSITFQKTSATLAGTVSSIAVDPSDTTGNTVYVGTASGGIWKTQDFLTTSPSGPTWVPLTDFGPNFDQNIGSLAVFGKNSDPSQSIIFAGTGFAQEATTNNSGNPNVALNSGTGGDILRSSDGGKTWQVVLSVPGATTYKIIVDPSPNGNGDPIVYAAMGAAQIGDSAFNGLPNDLPGGLYRSLDGGATWTQLAAGNATDILLDPASKSPTTGDLDTLYVAFANPIAHSNTAYTYTGPVGVFVSTNQGQTLQAYTGELGKNPLLVTPGFPATPLPVQNSTTVSPNNTNSAYIVLAKPALTSNTAENLAYEGYLYAAVENYNGTFQGLYVTKDAGENWTLVQLGNIPGNGSVKAAVPTNTTTNTDSYDPTSSQFNQEGAYNLTLTVDPTNPDIVYIGGSENFQGSGMIRIDLTDLVDAHNFTSFSNDQSDGGKTFEAAQGGVVVTNPALGPAAYEPIVGNPQPQIIDLRYAPNNGTPGTSPFNINATLVLGNTTSFVNSGTGVTWSLLDEPLKANPGDVTSSTNLHDVVSYVDPTTGNVRLLFGDDLGIFTALLNPDGTMDNGIGSDFEPNYSRNGNLQNEQLLTSAAEPSAQAASESGAEFFASGQSTIAAQSDPNVLTDGNLTWDNSAVLSPSTSSPRNVAANSSINSSIRSGVGIATDQTGGVSTSNPNGTPTLYEFDIPILGGNLTDFFRVNQFGQTTGLDANVNQEFPAQGYDGDAHEGGDLVPPVTNIAPNVVGAITNGQIPEGDFEVNPLNGQQILLSSATGNLYETTNGGILWTLIGSSADFGSLDAIIQSPLVGTPPGQFDGTPARTTPITVQVSAVAYGAPDPNVSGGVGNLNNFIYVGTTGINYTIAPAPMDPYRDLKDGNLYNDGKIYVTQAGGQGWTDISSGLDGSSVVGIYPAPDRGSHAAYAVTKTGIFFSPDTVGLAAANQTVWTNITSNLTSLDYDAFGNPANQQSVLAPFQYSPINGLLPGNPPTLSNLASAPGYNPVYDSSFGGFTDIVADYRYQIPETNATTGVTSFFPVLYASGYGGVFRSIDNGATWTVFPDQAFDNAPVDGGYLPHVDVTNLQLVLGDINPDTGHAVQTTGDPEILLATTYGRGDFAIRLAPDVFPTTIQFDPALPAPDGSDSSGIGITNVLEPFLDGLSEVSNFGNVVTVNVFDQSRNPNGTPTAGFGTLLGTATTNALGQFVVQIVDSGQDPTFFTSSTAVNDKTVGIQATDSAGASGNLTLFSYTLDLIDPVTPDTPVLEATYDTGRSSSDDLTNLSVPAQAGPGAPLNVVTPTFDVTTSLPQANPLSPNPISLTIELLRATSPNGPFLLIDSTQTGFINGTGTAETYMLTDPQIAAMAAAGIDETFYYEALQIDLAGNVSTPASNVLPVTVDTPAPVAPPGLPLVSTSPPMPVFSVTGVLPNDQVLLYRSVNGGAPVLVNGAQTIINTTNNVATLDVTDTLGAFPDGVYTYYAAQLDVYGNFSPLTTNGLIVTINTQTPPAAPILESAYDTGRSNSDDVTDIAVPAPTPGSTPNFVVPVFDVNTVAPPAGQPAIATVQLFRSNTPTGPFTLVGSTAFTGNPAMVTDGSLQALAATMPIDQNFYYEADQINASGIVSAMSPALKILVDTITPPTLAAPTLDPKSNTGLIQSQNITNSTHPIIDATNLLPGDQLFLYRSTGGKAPILVGTGPINTTGGVVANVGVTDTTGAVPDGVYQYYVVQQDLAGNISNFSASIAVTVNTTTPVAPTIALLASDDTGLPNHPNVTSVNTPHFVGTAQFNAGTNFPVAIINTATGAVLATTFPSANGTYEAQITTPLADGVYTLEARTENQAGNFSYSSPLTITIKHTGPQITPSLIISPTTDTGIKGDGVTSNHDPIFTGTTDKGDTVSLYVLEPNGTLMGPEATTTSNSVSGAFSLQLPFNLTDGTTELVAQTTDIANNKGALSAPLSVRITTTEGDYLGTGQAQLVVFSPYNETYYIRGIGSLQVDMTPGRDIPIQYDFNGDGKTDLSAFRYNTAEFFGYVSNNTGIDLQYGVGNASLPVSGYYGTSGTYINGIYIPATGTWAIALPQPGGLVINFGVPKVDLPVPAAYNGGGVTELAVFQGNTDSFDVIGPNGIYSIDFAALPKAFGFTYHAGDIPDPADYNGVGSDQFAVYRPSTGQFFILNTPNVANSATWTMRTVTLNLPGGGKAGDQPVSEDYDGDGKVDPTVYRPSNSTFYMISTTTGFQSNIQFQPFISTAPNTFIAAAGPIQYRLLALLGGFTSTGGYTTTGGGGTGGGGSAGASAALSVGSGGGGGGGSVHAESVTSPSAGTSGSPLSTMIAIATPLPVATTPTPSVPAATSAAPISLVKVGASTPVFAPVVASKAATTTSANLAKSKKTAKPLVVDSGSHESEAKSAQAKAHATTAQAKAHATANVKAASTTSSAKSHATTGALAVTSLQHLVMATKGRKKG